MRVHVVGTVLGVILDDEDGGLRPEYRMADGLDEPAQRKVIVRDQRPGRVPAPARQRLPRRRSAPHVRS